MIRRRIDLKNMKRLIIIDIILLTLVYSLPSTPSINNMQHTEENIQVNNVIEETKVEISSRSLEEPRQIEDIEEVITSLEEITTTLDIENEVIVPTTYSEKLVKMVKKYEGFKNQAYKLNRRSFLDNSDLDIIGADVKEGQTITEEAADRLLRAELDGARDYVLKHCDYLELTQGQLDALTSFTYNGGLGMLKKLTANKTRNAEEIAEHITAYTNGGLKGLVLRRNEELKMFKGDD